MMTLSKAKIGQTEEIKAISGTDKIKTFLLSLGCSEGEEITLISNLGGNFIISVKNNRYAIDKRMAKAIELVV